MYGDFDIIVFFRHYFQLHMSFFTEQCAVVSCNYHFCEVP